MKGKTGEPVPVWGTVLGVAFSLLVGIGGVLLAVNREEGFTTGDAVVPASIGILIGLLVVGVVLWLYYAKRWRPDPERSSSRCPFWPGSAGRSPTVRRPSWSEYRWLVAPSCPHSWFGVAS